MKNIILYFVLSFIFLGCSAQAPKPVQVEVGNKTISYLKDVKPILDARCVSCHSCYNSPCQAKMSSFEGLQRGASKLLVYDALRLSAMDPTRLFVDAKNTKEWRAKGFYALTSDLDDNITHNDSIMIHMLHDKKMNPDVIGSYRPESDELSCPKNSQEMGEYLEEKPNHGMPYGFPAIKESEYKILSGWLAQGAKGPTPKEQKRITTPSKAAAKEIKKWEKFLNTPDAKHTLTARYLYEHFFLAHWHFKTAPNEFYEIVRSRTPHPQQIDVIPSVRPFDDPKVEKFYYRLQRIHSTIVHKTHMVVEFDDAKLKRIQKLFIDTPWDEKPHYVNYETKMSANPFLSFAQIPPKSRYKFLLNNAHYIIMNFIRGPVCRGQMALNVIHDHFWIMFEDPEHDITIQDPKFLLSQAENLSMPIETSSQRVLQTFSDAYQEKYKKYFTAKEKLYIASYPEGQNIDAIWKGERAEDAPLLTIYRHFDSASVHKGVLGTRPRTVWVVDYALLEHIYYNLVAGYDVFGNISHQTNVRRYADFLRFEGEMNFITFMPQKLRFKLLKSWYINSNFIKENSLLFEKNTQIKYQTSQAQKELVEKVVNEHILKSTQIKFDKINYFKNENSRTLMPKNIDTAKDVAKAFRTLHTPDIGFVKHVTDGGVNTMLLRIILPNGKSEVYTIVVNRWHDNVNSMFTESRRLKPEKDTLDFIPFSVGSYPNSFAVVETKDLDDFFDIIKKFDGGERYQKRFSKYFIGRSDENFWETFDWFQNYFYKKETTEAGLYDLNRYYHK